MYRFVLKKYFHKNIHIALFNKYFYRNKKSKLYFGDRVAVLNDFLYECGGSTCRMLHELSLCLVRCDDVFSLGCIGWGPNYDYTLKLHVFSAIYFCDQ